MLDLLCYDETSTSGLRWSNASKHGKRPPGAVAGTQKKNGYWQVCVKRKLYLCHRLVWQLHHGDIPEGMSIDHIDRHRGNNRIENLRLATPTSQQRNRKRKYMHFVTKDRNRFKASFWLNKEYHHCGCHGTEQEAHLAAVAGRLELYWTV